MMTLLTSSIFSSSVRLIGTYLPVHTNTSHILAFREYQSTSIFDFFTPCLPLLVIWPVFEFSLLTTFAYNRLLTGCSSLHDASRIRNALRRICPSKECQKHPVEELA